MKKLLQVSSLALLLGFTSLRAQDVSNTNGPRPTQTAEPSTGTVTGMVIAQDTQRPARFATVQFQRVTAAEGPSPSGQGNFGGPLIVRTDIDGMFTAVRVAVGDYYVTATEAGYISQGALLRAQVAAGGDPAALLAAVPVVRVTPDSTSNITVNIQRGGVIAGHVEWEDGSVASGVSVNVTSTTAAQIPQGANPLAQALRGLQSFAAGQPFAQTDDRGNFRVGGLATGEYIVTGTMQAPSQIGGVGRFPVYSSLIRVYAPGVFRRADAKTVSVRAGDERTDVRMVIDLRGLHTVSGHASSATGESVATGIARLTDNSDTSLQPQAQIEADGSFKLRYVPAGVYTLRITGANSQPQNFGHGGRGQGDGGGPKGVGFQEFSTTITVSDTDVTGVGVSLVAVQSQSR